MDGLSDTPSTLTAVPRTDGGKLFDAMATSFAERLRELKGLMMLRTADEPEEALTAKLAKIDASLTSVEQALREPQDSQLEANRADIELH